MNDFTANNGQIQKFMRRHGHRLRMRTTVAQKTQNSSLTNWLLMFYKLDGYRDFLATNLVILLQWTKLQLELT